MSKDSQSLLHERSRRYWESVSTTYLAAAEYYDAQEVALLSTFSSRNARFESGLDLGCGDGRFTLVASAFCDTILGVDINSQLIAQAERRLPSGGVGARVRFMVGAVDDEVSFLPSELVMCLGVTSCVIEEKAFKSVVDLVGRSVLLGGTVILKDTLAKQNTIINQSENYVAIYRSRAAYVDAFESVGLRFFSETMLSQDDDTENSLMVFIKKNLTSGV